MLRAATATALLTAAGLTVGCGPSKKELQADLDATRGELTSMTAQRDKLSADVKAFKVTIEELEQANAVARAELEKLSAAKELTDDQLEAALAEQARRDEELKTYKRLFARLKNLVDTGKIKVVFRKGKMMVQLESAVLFDSGKTRLKPAGKVSVAAVTDALKEEGRDFLVAGHTDNVPIRTARFRSNWELSTKRAVVVLNYMVEQGFPPKHLGAAGFGEFDPVAKNDSPDGQAENRRIEITLMPSPAQLKGIQAIFGPAKAIVRPGT